MWGCQCKFAKFYWALCNQDGSVIKTTDLKKELPNPTKGQKIERKFYEGCPKYQFLDYNKEMAKKSADKGLLEKKEQTEIDLSEELW